MNDDNEDVAAAAPASPTPITTVRRRWKWILAAVIVLPVLLITLYTGIAVRWSYSDGARAGVLQKLSKKGWICKTWEGELAMTTVPGVAPTLWSFTVRDSHAAELVSASIGQRVRLHYTEHRGVPSSCFGETPYYVDSVAVLP